MNRLTLLALVVLGSSVACFEGDDSPPGPAGSPGAGDAPTAGAAEAGAPSNNDGSSATNTDGGAPSNAEGGTPAAPTKQGWVTIIQTMTGALAGFIAFAD